MSKTFNHAQAKSYREERAKLQQDELHKRNVREELEVLRVSVSICRGNDAPPTTLGCLIAAVDAYVEQLTGDMHALWTSSVDIKRWWDD